MTSQSEEETSSTEPYESWEPLVEIVQMAWCDASYPQMHQWSRKAELNGFPEPKEQFGDKNRYKFYDPAEVRKWYTLYKKATKNMGRANALNEVDDDQERLEFE